MKDRWEQEALQARREMRDQLKEDRRRRSINLHMAAPARMGFRLFPADTGLADRLRVEIAARHDATSCNPGGTIEQIALHEAGHFVAAEALGMVATTAEIHGYAGGRGGWGGSAGAWERPVLDRGEWGFTAEEVEHEGAFTLAGPVAEHLFKGGDPYRGLGEILVVCIIAAHLADLRRESRAITLSNLFASTAQVVRILTPQIEEIAGFLKSQRSIHRAKARVAKCLSRVPRLSIQRLPLLTAGESAWAADILAQAPMDLLRFTEEVGR